MRVHAPLINRWQERINSLLPLSSAAVIVLSLWHSLSGLAAVTGNALVLWLFYKNKSLRTISNRFITSLSAADFFVGIVVNPAWIVFRCLMKHPETHVQLFEVMNVLWVHTTASTTFNLCCVSVDRFIAIRFPLRYQDILTKKRCHAAVISVWIASLLLPCSLALVHNNHKSDEILWITLPVLTFMVPTTVVTFCYCWIFKAARKQTRLIMRENMLSSDEQNETRRDGRVTHNYKALKTVGFVLGVFIVSWMPCLVVSILHNFVVIDQCLESKFYVIVWPWIEVVALTSSSSSAINPFRHSDFNFVKLCVASLVGFLLFNNDAVLNLFRETLSIHSIPY